MLLEGSIKRKMTILRIEVQVVYLLIVINPSCPKELSQHINTEQIDTFTTPTLYLHNLHSFMVLILQQEKLVYTLLLRQPHGEIQQLTFVKIKYPAQLEVEAVFVRLFYYNWRGVLCQSHQLVTIKNCGVPNLEEDDKISRIRGILLQQQQIGSSSHTCDVSLSSLIINIMPLSLETQRKLLAQTGKTDDRASESLAKSTHQDIHSQSYVSLETVPPQTTESHQSLSFAEKEVHQWETDSNDSCVSFEANMLDQHIFTLSFLLQKLQRSFFKSYAINFADTEKSSPELFQDDIEDYVAERAQSMGQQFSTAVLGVLSEENQLRRFLRWIYESSPQIFIPDLVQVFLKTVMYHRQLKQMSLAWNELVHLASSPQFLVSVFRDQALTILTYRQLENEQPPSQDQCISLPYFMRFYSLTLLLVLENYFNHPLYEEAKKIRRKELEERFNQRKRMKSALSKKIKKRGTQKQVQ